MHLRSYNEFDITTNLSPAEAELRLKKAVVLYNQSTGLFEWQQAKPYLFVGNVHNGEFKLERNNPSGKIPVFASVIKGRIAPDKGGSKVWVKTTLASGAIIISLTVFEIVLIAFAVFSKEYPIIFLAILMPFIAYITLVVNLASDAAVIKLDLERVLV